MTPAISLEHYPNIEIHRDAILQHLHRSETPILLCDRDILTDRFQTLRESMSRRWPQYVIGYSFKTNYLVAETQIFQELGGWAEVVSGREYRMARQLGFDGAKIIFNGPYKTDADLTAAITDGALINVNDHDELDRLLHIAQLQREPVTLGLRVSATLPRLGHSRFGFSLENDEAKGAIDKIARSSQVELTALHMHLYADTDDAAIYGHAVDAIGQFLQHNLPDYQRQIQWMNLGGGFPAHIAKPKSREAWDPQPIDVYIGAITDALRQYFPRETTQPTLIVEPGRYLTSDGIVLVTEVVHVKRREGKQVVNSNGSISMVPLTHYCPQIVRAYTRTLVERNATMVPTVIHGATCRENDVLFDGPFPVVSPGDYLITFAAGAYNSSLSPDFIFAAPRMQLI